MALVDGDGALVLASRRLEEMFGYEHGVKPPGQTVGRLIPADLQAAHRSQWATYARAPRTRPMTVRLVGLRKDATTFPVEIGLSPVTTAAGRLAFAVIRDVTAAKQLEALIDLARSAVMAQAGTPWPGTPGHHHHPLVPARAQPAGRYRPTRGHGPAADRRNLSSI